MILELITKPYAKDEGLTHTVLLRTANVQNTAKKLQ